MSHIANNVAAQNIWDTLRRSTPVSDRLGRSGDALPTTRGAEFGTAHAAARDAVHTPLTPRRWRAE
ncbi:ethanolamine ammonia-lyase light chain EutC [Mycobacteroides abscessus]|uniref:ethanolamine ammonia-lyase light chain EutC n=1 Tax=Mycobacteroides abscessus TaxID=36809 RepID=UPI003CC6C601